MQRVRQSPKWPPFHRKRLCVLDWVNDPLRLGDDPWSRLRSISILLKKRTVTWDNLKTVKRRTVRCCCMESSPERTSEVVESTAPEPAVPVTALKLHSPGSRRGHCQAAEEGDAAAAEECDATAAEEGDAAAAEECDWDRCSSDHDYTHVDEGLTPSEDGPLPDAALALQVPLALAPSALIGHGAGVTDALRGDRP